VHRADGGRIRHRRQCSACGQTVDLLDIGRGYPLGGGHLVLDEADLSRLPLPSVRAMDVVAFVPVAEVDPIYFQRDRAASP
jgi:DNA end-binding protein Ku